MITFVQVVMRLSELGKIVNKQMKVKMTKITKLYGDDVSSYGVEMPENTAEHLKHGCKMTKKGCEILKSIVV